MKKLLLILALTFSMTIILCFAISAETITVEDNGTVDIILGECVIENLNKQLPEPSRGFTYALNTETKTAKITSWANKNDVTLGRTFCIPSTVTYDGLVYTVTAFSAIGVANVTNNIVVTVAIPDTVTSIPNNAFDCCRAIKYVYIGKNVETIGEYCFRNAGFTASDTIDSVTGEAMGNIKDFIWQTTKITTLPRECFFHMDFEEGFTIKFAFENITTFGSACMAYNMHAFQTGHKFNKQLFLDSFDITKATSVASNAFDNAALSDRIIVRADQVNALRPYKLRGQGTAQPVKNNTFIVVGGATKSEAITLTEGIWIPNAWYWGGTPVHFNIVINGYVNAYDGTDGLENQNGYGHDVVDYFFESEDAFNHYLSTLDKTTNRVTTYTRYAKNTKGYFNVCTVVDGVHSYKAYNLKYTAAAEGVEESIEIVEYAQSSFSFGYPELVTILDDDCTASTVCMCCDMILAKGLEHNLNVTITYENGYLADGVKGSKCTNDGCLYCAEDITVKPLFVSRGYSTNGDSILQSFGVNLDALNEYKTTAGITNIEYGVLAGSVNKLGEVETVFDKYNNLISGVASVNYSDKKYDLFEMKIMGIKDEYKSYALYLCAYVIVDGKVTYLTNGAESDKISSSSYNEIVSE